MKQTIKVSQETKDTIDALVWFFELSGGDTGIMSSSTHNCTSLYREQSCCEEPKELRIEVE